MNDMPADIFFLILEKKRKNLLSHFEVGFIDGEEKER
jgi:hypothetical protein